MIQLSSKERAFLKKMAHNLDPIVRIGKDGIDENVLKSIAEVVKKRELTSRFNLIVWKARRGEHGFFSTTKPLAPSSDLPLVGRFFFLRLWD